MKFRAQTDPEWVDAEDGTRALYGGFRSILTVQRSDLKGINGHVWLYGQTFSGFLAITDLQQAKKAALESVMIARMGDLAC